MSFGKIGQVKLMVTLIIIVSLLIFVSIGYSYYNAKNIDEAPSDANDSNEVNNDIFEDGIDDRSIVNNDGNFEKPPRPPE
jgi:hypothetical protein